MSGLAVAHPQITHPRPLLLPAETSRWDQFDEDGPVTVTISVAAAAGDRQRFLAALRELADAVGAAGNGRPGEAGHLPTAEIRLDPRARTAFRGGRLLELSRLEYDLLLFLARHPRRVFSRSQLLTQVWGHRHTTDRTVDVHVSRLRTKLDGAEVIVTVYGVGYRLAEGVSVLVEPEDDPSGPAAGR